MPWRGDNMQPDLVYLSDVLASTGWNANDDYFHPDELWKARHTAEDKPVNMEHDEGEIVGHIKENVAAVGGEPVEGRPEGDFDIVTRSVLYKSWRDEGKKRRTEEILDGLRRGEWYVSMECKFPSYDYALQTAEGTKILKRDGSTSFLSRYLRAHGGPGVYNGMRVGRVFRDLYFSGKGLVKRPANPRSVILSSTAAAPEGNMEELTKKMEQALQDAEASRAELVNVRAESAKAAEAYEGKLHAFEAQLAAQAAELESRLKAQAAELESRLAEAKSLNESLEQANKGLAASVAALEHEKKVAGRARVAGKELGLDEDKAQRWAKSSEGLSDEAFAAQIEVARALRVQGPPAPVATAPLADKAAVARDMQTVLDAPAPATASVTPAAGVALREQLAGFLALSK